LSIIENYKEIESQVNKTCEKYHRNSIKILAVSKTFPLGNALELYEYGVRDFGENYAQELKSKQEELDKTKYSDIRWHFIGHLQSNKVKYLAEYVYAIHSVDSLKLAQEISKQAIKFGRQINPIKILLQVHTSGEESKSGINPNELIDITKEIIKLEGIELIGLMTITALTDDPIERVPEFQLLEKLLFEINQNLNLNLTELSMGMSDDYEYAIENGSTMVRIGTAIFVKRNYSN
jgi:pyridoxal phosphate enzyme (YggS family)